jgi:hypothetical protein
VLAALAIGPNLSHPVACTAHVHALVQVPRVDHHPAEGGY